MGQERIFAIKQRDAKRRLLKGVNTSRSPRYGGIMSC